jgi:hypothetical protein
MEQKFKTHIVREIIFYFNGYYLRHKLANLSSSEAFD